MKYRIIFEGSTIIEASSKEEALGGVTTEIIDRDLLLDVEEIEE